MSSLNAFVSTTEEFRLATAAVEKAPPGPRKETALVHLRSAETAQAAHQEADCLKALSAAIAALERAD